MSSKKRKSADTTDNGGDEGGDAGQPAFNRKEKGVWKKMKAEGLVEQVRADKGYESGNTFDEMIKCTCNAFLFPSILVRSFYVSLRLHECILS